MLNCKYSSGKYKLLFVLIDINGSMILKIHYCQLQEFYQIVSINKQIYYLLEICKYVKISSKEKLPVHVKLMLSLIHI